MTLQKTIDTMYAALNRVRMQPSSQAIYYEGSKSLYHGLIYRQNVKTRQGVNALQNLVNDLKHRQSIPQKLKWSFALHMAADQQAIKLGDNGLTTTDGTRFHVSVPDRCKQYGVCRGRLTQVYEFGGNSAEQILQCLLIDDGLVSRKRRKTLLDPIYNYVGIGTSYHQKYGTVTVIILAEDIISLVTPGDEGNYYKRETLPQGQVYTFSVNEQKQNQKRQIMQYSRQDSFYSQNSRNDNNLGYGHESSNKNRPQNENQYQNALRNPVQSSTIKKEETSCSIF